MIHIIFDDDNEFIGVLGNVLFGTRSRGEMCCIQKYPLL